MWLFYWVAIIFAQENRDFFSQLDRLERESTVLKNTATQLVILFDSPPEEYPMLSIEQSLLQFESTMNRIENQMSYLEQNYESSHQRD